MRKRNPQLETAILEAMPPAILVPLKSQRPPEWLGSGAGRDIQRE